MGVHGRMPRLYLVRMTYLAQVRIARIRARWLPRGRVAQNTIKASPAVESPAPVGLAETIAMAAAGRARLEVSTVEVTLRRAPEMQRWVAVERSRGDCPPTLAVVVQSRKRESTDISP